MFRMEASEFAYLTHSLQTISIGALVFLLFTYIPKFRYRVQFAKLPALSAEGEKQRNEYLTNGKKLYREGYQKFKNSVYRLTTFDGQQQVIVAPRFLPELRKLPDSVVSFPKAIENLMEVKYTNLLHEELLVTHSVRSDLTPALGRLNPLVYAEVKRALREEMPNCEDWTALNIYPKLANVVAKATGIVFVGPELSRDEKYQRLAVDYTMQVIAAQHDIKKIRPILRPWYAPRLASVKRLKEAEKEAEEFLEPIIQARRDAEANDPDWKRPDDMLSWFMSRQDEYGPRTSLQLAQMQLGLIFAAIHTTTLTTTNIIYTLAVSSEYVEPLREEIRQAMSENGGVINTRALQHMIKLDSFMREASRFNPPGFTTFMRKVIQGITLSNGQYIPAGTTIEVASDAIHNDPDNFTSGEPVDVFDGFRYYKRRQTGEVTDNARNQFVTSNEQSLMFGYGAHACPGRFFAANEIKMMLARLLLEYDIQNENRSKVRYPNLNFGKQSAADTSKNLLFKRTEYQD